jgi:ubiquinone/menaquinone biosynthesis C-methylase UbiE
MSNASTDAAFSGAIPKIYEEFLVPLLFQPYAADLAQRVAARAPMRVLELAAGTGVVTRAIVAAVPATTSIVATDLNEAMIDEAKAIEMARSVEWRQADAIQLPFEDASFDLVACQFGVMFFPDRVKAYAEARRVLRPGGAFLFNVWDSLDDNEVADAVVRAVSTIYPSDPPSFLQRTPYGYHSHKTIQADLAKAGFAVPATFDVVTARGRSPNTHAAAVGYCQGTPLRAEIEARSPAGLGTTTDEVAAAMARKFGKGAIDTKIQAIVVTAPK